MPHVKMPAQRQRYVYEPERVYICARSLYILVRQSPARFIYNVQRPNSIYLLCDLVLAMVCVKKMSLCRGSSLFIETRTRYGHGTAIAITVTNTIYSRAYLTTVCCQEKRSGKYLTYHTGGYGSMHSYITTTQTLFLISFDKFLTL